MKKKNKKILIVGGTGFIGFHLSKFALKKNLQVTSISTNRPKNNRKLQKVKYLFCDISDKKKLKKILQKKNFDYVVNLGGYVDHSKKIKTYRSHYLGLKNLIDYFKKTKIKKFVQIGSSVEYGFNKTPQKESMVYKITEKTSTYGKAKILSTKYSILQFKKNNFPITILRLYLVYGPYQEKNRFIPIVIDGCLKNKDFKCSSGSQIRDFIYIDDVVEAIYKVLKNEKVSGEILNLASGKPTNIKKIIEFIKEFLKSGHPKYGLIKLREDEPKKLYPSISKIKRILRWEPKTNLFIGIKKTIKYYKHG